MGWSTRARSHAYNAERARNVWDGARVPARTLIVVVVHNVCDGAGVSCVADNNCLAHTRPVTGTLVAVLD